MLLEMPVDCREDAVGIDDVAYDKPARQSITAPSFAEPVEAAFHGIAEGVALEIAIAVGWVDCSSNQIGKPSFRT